MVGSPAYMSPERARGEAPTTASDLWSLGATLFAAVRGRSPFQREGQLPTLSAVISEPAPALPGSGALPSVVERLLAKDPGDAAHRRRRPGTCCGAAAARSQRAARGAAAPRAGSRRRLLPSRTPAEPPPTAPRRAADPGAGRRPCRRAPPEPRRRDRAARAPRRGRGRRAAAAAGRRPGAPRRAAADVAAVRERAGHVHGPEHDAAGHERPAGVGHDSPDGHAPPATAPGSAVPAGFRAHTDPTGFALAVPEGWRRSTQGSRTYFREPGGGRFLQVDQTTDPRPDAVADWEAQEGAVAERLSGYRRIRLEPVEYRGWDAADWEFTWRSDGRLLHVLSRNIRVSDERAYALYFSVPDDRWAESRPLFDTFAATFRPAP